MQQAWSRTLPKKTNSKPIYKICKLLHDLASTSFSDHICQHKQIFTLLFAPSSLRVCSPRVSVLFRSFAHTTSLPGMALSVSPRIQLLRIFQNPPVTSSVEMSSDSSRLHVLPCMKVSVYISFLLSCNHLSGRNWVYSSFIPRNQIRSCMEKVLTKCLEIDGWTELR